MPPRGLSPIYLGAYIALLVYGSLYPLGGLHAPAGLAELLPSWPAHAGLSDVVLNLVVYAPLGGLAALTGAPRPMARSLLAAILLGLAVSLAMELTQGLLPARDGSWLDVLLNVAGALAGAGLASQLRMRAQDGRHRLEAWLAGPGGSAALLLVLLWVLTETAPWVPSLDLGEARHALAPLRQWLAGELSFRGLKWLSATAQLLVLGALLKAALGSRSPWVGAALATSAAVLLGKVLVIGRSLSPEWLAAWPVAVLLWSLGRRQTEQRTALWGLGAALLYMLGAALLPAVADTGHYRMQWVPFAGQLGSGFGLTDVMEEVYAGLALGLLTRLRWRLRPLGVHVFGALVFIYALALELAQQWIPGRHADVTDALLVLLGWYLARALATGTEGADDRPLRLVLPLGILLLAVNLALSTDTGLYGQTTRSEDSTPNFPRPEDLPAPELPGFREQHPRLPAPSAGDIAWIRQHDPNYQRQLLRRAKGGKGGLEAVIEAEVFAPGSNDLDLLLQRLLGLEFMWRGHAQVKPLAMAYDWLHERWSPQQRAALADKLAAGCDYLIERIRSERYSPYNVYLYNSPLQALVACAIALYGEHPRGAPVMAFTRDFWRHRVLPVWAQIMGEHGGWHEGKEYVGIGIGDAIYQIPAMWRRALGEDSLHQLPGIRGFLDFLIHRLRPDGEQFRWGDGNFYDRRVPDQRALAMAFDDAAAYTAAPQPQHFQATAWPWGPLPEDDLIDPGARERLPLVRLFDGLGLLVARSDWGPDASYVTFKASDNYWSHSHLDQGAFTIYKGGALALDSGVNYGVHYGGDHHMNYSYQSIAHNLITVTDPADTVPMPPKDPDKDAPRPIANDGGQRRIGSGWGRPAPIDLADWQAQRETYHTGSITDVHVEQGISLITADLTAAFTNDRSGTGDFSARTRRVERWIRSFGYDASDEVVVVYDHVVSSDPSFRKRWLLHSTRRPELRPHGFELAVDAEDRAGHRGGRLLGRVLLPAEPRLERVGGPGHEYWVDGHNYDDGGALTAILDKRRHQGQHPEPGAWRIELGPSRPAAADDFLVVMLPRLADAGPAPHRIRRLDGAGGPGVEVAGPHHTTRWRFDPDSAHARVEVLPSAGAQAP